MYMCKNCNTQRCITEYHHLAARVSLGRMEHAGFSFFNVCTTYACTNFFRGSAISMYWFGEKMHSVTNKNIGPTD